MVKTRLLSFVISTGSWTVAEYRLFVRGDVDLETSPALRAVLAEAEGGSRKTLDVHVASLRRKLDEPSRIVTLRRIGYRLNVNV